MKTNKNLLKISIIVGSCLILLTALVLILVLLADKQKAMIMGLVGVGIIFISLIITWFVITARKNEIFDKSYLLINFFLKFVSLLLALLVFIETIQTIQFFIELAKYSKEINKVGEYLDIPSSSDVNLSLQIIHLLISKFLAFILKVAGAIICGIVRINPRQKPQQEAEAE